MTSLWRHSRLTYYDLGPNFLTQGVELLAGEIWQVSKRNSQYLLQELFAKNHRGGPLAPPPSGARDKRRAPLCSRMEFIGNNGQHTYVQRQMQLRDSLGSYRQHSLGFVYWCVSLYRDSDGIGTLIFETLNREKTQGTETREAEDTTCQQIHLKDINQGCGVVTFLVGSGSGSGEAFRLRLRLRLRVKLFDGSGSGSGSGQNVPAPAAPAPATAPMIKSSYEP